jgi:hypothetical protein
MSSQYTSDRGTRRDAPRPDMPMASKTNGYAVASLVLSLVWMLGLGSLLAVIFGHIALGQIKRDPYQGGKGLAIAGLVIGYAALALILVVIIAAAAGSPSTT